MTCIFGEKIMMERNRVYFFQPEGFEGFLKDYNKQLKIKGSKRAILSTMKNVPVRNYLHGYEELGKLEIPTLLIWGKQDVSFNFDFSEDLLEVYPAADDYLDLALQLSEIPVSVFKYKYPKEVALEIFGSKGPRVRPNLKLV